MSPVLSKTLVRNLCKIRDFGASYRLVNHVHELNKNRPYLARLLLSNQNRVTFQNVRNFKDFGHKEDPTPFVDKVVVGITVLVLFLGLFNWSK